jgi:hypothetical protein
MSCVTSRNIILGKKKGIQLDKSFLPAIQPKFIKMFKTSNHWVPI